MTMDPFERVPIGTTDVTVSRLGMGTAPLGGWPEALPAALADATLRRAWEVGIRYFDTAPLYGHGLSERSLGRVLSGLPREAFTLSTKVGRVLEPGQDPDSLFRGTPDVRPVFDFSSDGVRRSFASSRERLRMDRVDIVLIHDPDDHHEEALRSAYPELDAMRRDGVIGAIGVGMNFTEPLIRFANEADFDCVLLAGRYTLLEQDSLPLLELAVQRRMSIIVGGALNSGLLVDPKPGAMYNYAPAPDHVVERAVRIRQVCERFEVPLRAAALRFPFAHPAVRTVVVGARSPAEIDDNLDLLRRDIPPELWIALKEEGLLRSDAPTP
jgi:D-threo-aldose 1-dehydrogenase